MNKTLPFDAVALALKDLRKELREHTDISTDKAQSRIDALDRRVEEYQRALSGILADVEDRATTEDVEAVKGTVEENWSVVSEAFDRIREDLSELRKSTEAYEQTAESFVQGEQVEQLSKQLSTDIELLRAERNTDAEAFTEFGKTVAQHEHLAALESRIRTRLAEVSDTVLETQETLTEKHNHLTEKHDRLTEQTNQLDEAVTKNQEQYNHLDEKTSQLTEKHNQLEEAVSNTKSQLEEAVTQTKSQLTEKHDQLNEQVISQKAISEQQAAETKAAIDAIAKRIEALPTDALQADVEALQAALNARTQKDIDIERTVNGFADHIIELDGAVDELRNGPSHEHLKAIEERLGSQLINLKDQLAEAYAKKSELDERGDHYVQRFYETHQEVKRVEESLAALRTTLSERIESTESEIRTDTDARTTELRERIGDVHRAVTDLRELVQDVETKHGTDLEHLQKELGDSTEGLRQAQSLANTTFASSIERVESQIQEQHDATKTLDTAVTEVKAEVEEVVRFASDTHSRVDGLEAYKDIVADQLGVIGKEIDATKEKAAERDAERVKYEHSILAAQSTLRESLEARIATLDESDVEIRAELDQHVSALFQRIKALGEQHVHEKALRDEQRVERETATLRRVDELRSELSGYVTQKDAQQTEDALRAAHADLRTYIDEALGEVEVSRDAGELEREEQFAEIRERIDASVKSLNAIVDDVREQQAARRDEVQKDIETLNAYLKDVGDEFSKVDDSLCALDDRMGNVEKLVDSVTLRFGLQEEEVLRQIRDSIEEKFNGAWSNLSTEAAEVIEQHRKEQQVEFKTTVSDAIETIRERAKGERGPEGRLRTVRTYVKGDRIADNEIVRHNGGVWQALASTKTAPSAESDDWALLADGIASFDVEQLDPHTNIIQIGLASGETKALTIAVPRLNDRGTYKTDETYRAGDSVLFNRVRWVAKTQTTDEPGASDDWYVEAMQGPKGEKGIPGKRGEQGEPGPRGLKGDQGIAPSADEIAKAFEQHLIREDGYAVTRFRGQWTYGWDYNAGDLVGFSKGLYICKNAHRAEMPPVSIAMTDQQNWEVVVPSSMPGVIQGPAGPPGPSGDAVPVVMAEDILQYNVVAYSDAGGVKADNGNTSAMTVQGIVTENTLSGEMAYLVAEPITWAAGGLSAGQSLFLGESGALTTTPPSTGWLRQIAVATGTNTIVVDIGQAYYLGV